MYQVPISSLYVNPEERSVLLALIEKQGHVKEHPVQLRRKDGTAIDTLITAGFRQDADGSKREYYGTIRDITDRKLAEDKQKVSEDKYRSIFENAVEGIFQSTADRHYLNVNPAFARMHGFETPEEMIRGVSSIAQQPYVYPEERQRIIEEVAEKGAVIGREAERYRKDGSKFWASLNVRAVCDSQGVALYYEGTLEDITSRKLAEEGLRQSMEKLRKSLLGTIRAISSTVETRDPYTAGHQRRVSSLARVIAQEMGLPNDTIDTIRMVGSIHDIGKISVPAEILSKPGTLTDIEFGLIKVHPQSGYDILKDAELPYPIAEIVLQHHERLDGSGYPQGLKDDQILLEARIISVADVVEAIASHRPYRSARGIDAALEEIEKNKGTLYDARVVEACLRLFRERGFRFDELR
jgi:PAS domain S-box-containing protein